MRATFDNHTTSSPFQRLANAWVLGFLGVASTDFRRMLSPWAYKHLRGLAAVHFTAGVFLAGLGVALLAHGIVGWAALPLAGAALHFTIGAADMVVARFAPSRA